MRGNRKPAEVRSPRMAPLSRLPVFYKLEGKRVVIAGGSPAAAWKAELLSAAGANVDVYAVDLCAEIAELAAEPPRGQVMLERRAWMSDDLRGAAVAIGAFGDDQSADAFAQAARALGVPVNIVDKPQLSDFAFGSIVNRSPLVVGISTDGAAPVFAQAIRAKLEAFLPKGFACWAAAAAAWRPMLKTSGLSFLARRRFWQMFTAQAVEQPNRAPNDGDLARLFADVKGLGVAVEQGSVSLVGAGPGDPELLTLRAVRALQSADVILFDDLVSREVLDFARREARKLLVGKTGYGPACKQDDINALMINLARQGKRVVRLKGGDPLIFARAGEEIAACKKARIHVDIVPGITAAQGAAARLGIPLTDRAHAHRVQFVTGHARSGQLPDDLDWRSLTDADATTAIYMPKRSLAALATRAIAEGLDPSTPAVAIARATCPDQVVIVAPIGTLSAHRGMADIDGPVLILMGRILEALKTDSAPRAGKETEIVLGRGSRPALRWCL